MAHRRSGAVVGASGGHVTDHDAKALFGDRVAGNRIEAAAGLSF